MPLPEILDSLLAHLDETTGAVPEEASEEDMIPWRQRIDMLDRVVLQLLNERVRCAAVIGAIKKQIGLPVYVPSREDEVLRNVIESNEGPMTDTAIRRLFERIIDETRSLERHLYQEEDDV